MPQLFPPIISTGPRSTSHRASVATPSELGGMVQPSDRKNLFVLQALRGVAALAVIGFHVNRSVFGVPKYWPDHPFGRLFNFGHSGVEFFFVLSGFIILKAHRRDIGQSRQFASFVWKRFRRIYPIYWIVLAGVIPVFFVYPSLGGGTKTTLDTLINSFLLARLLPSANQVLDVSWTLFHEVLFYATFSILVLNKRLGTIVVSLWIAVSLVVLVLGPRLPELLQFYFSPLHLLFALGMASAELVRRRWVPVPLCQLVVGLVLFATVAMIDTRLDDPKLMWLSICYGLASAIILSAAIEIERSGWFRVPRTMVVLGDASYSIYLVHFPALSVLAKMFLMANAHGLAIPHRIMFILMFTASAAAGLLFYLIIEKPLLATLARPKIEMEPRSQGPMTAPAILPTKGLP